MLFRSPFVDSFVLALNKAHVLALNTAHVLRLNKADVLALNKAHVLRLNSKICPVFSQSYRTTFLFDFFIPLSAKTYTSESISGKQLSKTVAKPSALEESGVNK